MILIDEHTETELAAALEAFKLAPEHATRCIQFNLSGKPIIPGLKEAIIASAQQHLDAYDAKMFICADGNITILSSPLPSKDGNQVIVDAATQARMPADQSWVIFDELARQTNNIMAYIMPILEKHRLDEEAARKLHEQQQHERKRQSILNGGLLKKSLDIKQRRTNRSKPELMIIEDDAFSRRLVENVLQKKYALTGLGEATTALDTYARVAPDLLFLDIDLPDVTGHELLERILAIDPDAHVIMLSGNADQTNIVQAMNKGAKGFIAKPFTKDKLFQYIDRCAGITSKQHSLSIS